jgi:hypothetical protein
MEKISCIVKLEGYDEKTMEFVSIPKKGENIVYNDESFEVKVVSHVIVKRPPTEIEREMNLAKNMEIDVIEENKVVIHASRVKRL